MQETIRFNSKAHIVGFVVLCLGISLAAVEVIGRSAAQAEVQEDDAGRGVSVDFKTTAIQPERARTYFRQRHSYAYALENQGDPHTGATHLGHERLRASRTAQLED